MDLSPTQLHDAPAVILHDADFGLLDAPSPRRASVATADGDATSPAAVMKRTLAGIFCEPDPTSRARVFDALWHSNAVIYSGDDARAGRAAVLEIADRFHQRINGLSCSPASPVSGSNDLYMLRWATHRMGRPIATGCCIGMLVRDRIHSFYMIED